MFSRKRQIIWIFTLAALSLVVLTLVTPANANEPASALHAGLAVDMDPYSLISEVNALRAANGLPGYSINPVLMAVAQQHAQYMSVAGVTHFGADGSTPWQRGLAAGYPLAGDLSLGGFYSENITAGRNKSVQQAVSEWQGDALHLNTMLSPNLTEIGVGVALVGDYVYYVIDCARPTASGQPQVYTPIPGQLPATGSTAVIVPRVVNTLVPSTPLADGKLYHVVKPGETLWLIAVSYGVKVADLRRLNNLTDTQDIFPGNKLYIQILNSATPAAPSPTATFPPTNTQLPTVTLYPTATLTLTPLPISSIPVESSTLVVAVIVIVALVLSAVIVRSGRRN